MYTSRYIVGLISYLDIILPCSFIISKCYPTQLYLLALEFEGMEQKALSMPEEDRVELLTRRDEIIHGMFSLLKLKTLDKQWNK